MLLSDLQLKQKARVVHFKNIDPTLRQRLLAFGLHRNASFIIERRAPLGDPLQIKVNNTSFSIRLQDIAQLEVEVEK